MSDIAPKNEGSDVDDRVRAWMFALDRKIEAIKKLDKNNPNKAVEGVAMLELGGDATNSMLWAITRVGSENNTLKAGDLSETRFGLNVLWNITKDVIQKYGKSFDPKLIEDLETTLLKKYQPFVDEINDPNYNGDNLNERISATGLELVNKIHDLQYENSDSVAYAIQVAGGIRNYFPLGKDNPPKS